jgi:hypothetical protein
MSNSREHAAEPVRLDHATLRSEPAGTHTRYTISLAGRPDAVWYAAYAGACEQAGLTQSFSLDRGRATVSFSCRVVEGPTYVMEMLERLEALLVSAERRYDAWNPQHATSPRPFPTAP